MGYSKKEVLEEVDKTIVELCKKCRAGSVFDENIAKLAHTLTDLIEVRASMPDWKDKPGTTTST